MKPIFRAIVALLVLAALGGGVAAYTVIRRGLSTQVAPSTVERLLARTMRYLATPADVRARQNPVEPTEAVLEEGLEHFADHCAGCHANDGSGDTALGRNLYPPAPDMREAATQNLSDGELSRSSSTAFG